MQRLTMSNEQLAGAAGESSSNGLFASLGALNGAAGDASLAAFNPNALGLNGIERKSRGEPKRNRMHDSDDEEDRRDNDDDGGEGDDAERDRSALRVYHAQISAHVMIRSDEEWTDYPRPGGALALARQQTRAAHMDQGTLAPELVLLF